MSVAVEQQALARVHRFGQTRPVRITRFITEHTVEVRPLLPLFWSSCPPAINKHCQFAVHMKGDDEPVPCH